MFNTINDRRYIIGIIRMSNPGFTKYTFEASIKLCCQCENQNSQKMNPLYAIQDGSHGLITGLHTTPCYIIEFDVLPLLS